LVGNCTRIIIFLTPKRKNDNVISVKNIVMNTSFSSQTGGHSDRKECKNIGEYVVHKIIEHVDDERVLEVDGLFSFLIQGFKKLTYTSMVICDHNYMPVNKEIAQKLQTALEKKFGSEVAKKYLENTFVEEYFLEPVNIGKLLCNAMIGLHPDQMEIFNLNIDHKKCQVMFLRFPSFI
jgi:hypothetical protein